MSIARLAMVFGGAAFLAGCSALEPTYVKRCEEELVRDLKAPSTYKRISLTNLPISDATTKYQSVSIEYDAQNSYGALIRGHRTCVYPLDGTDVREDLVGNQDEELGNALDGRGFYKPGAKMPTRAERSRQLSAEVDAILKREAERQKAGSTDVATSAEQAASDAANAAINAADNMEVADD